MDESIVKRNAFVSINMQERLRRFPECSFRSREVLRFFWRQTRESGGNEFVLTSMMNASRMQDKDCLNRVREEWEDQLRRTSIFKRRKFKAGRNEWMKERSEFHRLVAVRSIQRAVNHAEQLFDGKSLIKVDRGSDYRFEPTSVVGYRNYELGDKMTEQPEPKVTVTVETPEIIDEPIVQIVVTDGIPNDILITRERAFTPDELLKGMHLPEGVTIDREANKILAETPTYPTFVEGLKAALGEAPTHILVGTVRNIDADSAWSDAVQARLDEANSPESLMVGTIRDQDESQEQYWSSVADAVRARLKESMGGDLFHRSEFQDRIDTEMNNLKNNNSFRSYLYPHGSAFENRVGKQTNLGDADIEPGSLDPFSGVETSAYKPNFEFDPLSYIDKSGSMHDKEDKEQ